MTDHRRSRLTDLLRAGFFQRFWSIAGAVSVRTKVLGIVLGTVVLLGVFVIVQVRQSLAGILGQELETQALSIMQHVVESTSNLLNNGGESDLAFLLEESRNHYSDPRHNTQIAYLRVTTDDGVILGQTLADGIPETVLTPVNGPLADEHEEHALDWLDTGAGRILDVSERFQLEDGSTGIVQIGLSDAKMREGIDRVTQQMILTSLLISVVGVGAAVFLTWLITRPIRNLVQATQAVARGDLGQRVTPWANDEIGRLAEAFNTMTAALAQAAQEQTERERLRAQFVNRVIAAQEEERGRIARELHDSTSQSLTSLLVGLQALEQADAANLQKRTEDLRQVVSQTLEEVHGLAWQLRPSILDDLGLSAALERYVADYRKRYTLPVDLVIRGLDGYRLSSEVETTVYRIAQEALTNVARHAQADRVSVMIERREGKVLIIVEDDGVGLDPAVAAGGSHQRLGLYGIRERAELLGGKLKIESEHGQGTSLFVELPDCQPGEGKISHGRDQPNGQNPHSPG